MKTIFKLSLAVIVCIVLTFACSTDDSGGDNSGNSNPAAFAVTVSSVTESSALISWSASTDADGDSVTYSIYMNGTEIATGISALSYSVTGLNLNSAYAGTVVASDGNGGSAVSAYSFMTLSEPPTLHAAFAEFDTDETDIYLDGSEVVVETTGNPNHTTVYWGVGHPLYQAEPSVQLTPSIIPNYDGSAVLRVPTSPQLAAQSTATSLGAIGIAVSGAAIYNDQEGNGPLDGAAVSLDYTGGHIGPDAYHYHLEPKAWSDDDQELIGIMADGFFVYGRRDYPSNDYPTDLDASGGHFGPTPHNPDGEYHYHIQNELYLNQYYIIFPGDYQGTPNSIN